MRRLFLSLLAVTVSLGAGFVLRSFAAADATVELEELRWKQRVLLLPERADESLGSTWRRYAAGLAERDLVVFRRSKEGFVQVFPRTEQRVVLLDEPSSERQPFIGVTLIGKDGGVKRRWRAETADVPREVFARIDGMPMRQAEMRRDRALGQDLVGSKAPRWTVGPEWDGSPPLRLADLRGQVVVVRFWTDTCPFCAKSLPALQALADEFADAPVAFVGLYQSKPRGSERRWSDAVALARKLGVTFPLAYDHDWKTLRAWWLDGRPTRATSASFVIGPDGTIVHVHPGPVFFESDDPRDARANADYQAIRAAIRAHLPPRP
ncbi:MAG: redoxin domain-containing protein [Myxococcota bacterium]